MAKHSKKHHEEGEGGEAWLLPYSDLMTLLLAVFIVLFAVSAIDETKAAQAAAAFQGLLGGSSSPVQGGSGTMPDGSNTINLLPDLTPGVPPVPTPDPSKGESNKNLMEQGEVDTLTEVKEQLDQYFEENGLSAEVSTYFDERGLVINLSDAILFDSGKADIKPASDGTLRIIGEKMRTLDNFIRIEGHTDSVPISTAVYPSNWELSCARAARTVRFFETYCEIDGQKMVSVGYGETRPKADNATAEGRAQNRRVDIIILNSKYDSLERQYGDVPLLDEQGNEQP